jgi:hypothetical protein
VGQAIVQVIPPRINYQTMTDYLPPAIALIAPRMGSGKTTVATYLANHYGYQITPFAKPLRMMMTALLESFGIPAKEIAFLLSEGKETPILEIPGTPTPRRLMQLLGTDWGRKLVHDRIWVEAWEIMATKNRYSVADDCRFPNEYKAVKAIPGGQVWRITRQSAVITSAHASEGALDTVAVDQEITNDGTAGELFAKVDAILAGCRRWK